TTLTLQNGAVINNYKTFQTNASYVIGSGTGEAFRNFGDFVRANGVLHGGTYTQFQLPFDNRGTVDVESGTLQLWGGGTSSGRFRTQGDAGLSFDGTPVPHVFTP